MGVARGADLAQRSTGDSRGDVAGLPGHSRAKADEAANHSHGDEGNRPWLAVLGHESAERTHAGAQHGWRPGGTRGTRETEPTCSSWKIESAALRAPCHPEPARSRPYSTSDFSQSPIFIADHPVSPSMNLVRMKLDSTSGRRKAKVTTGRTGLLSEAARKGSGLARTEQEWGKMWESPGPMQRPGLRPRNGRTTVSPSAASACPGRRPRRRRR